jgi:ketosteroid isomerase-like protein
MLLPVDLTKVHNIFKNLESGDGQQFSAHVADDVDWTVEGTQSILKAPGP